MTRPAAVSHIKHTLLINMECQTQAAGESRQQNDNVQEVSEMVGGRVMSARGLVLVVEERGQPQMLNFTCTMCSKVL